MTTHSISARGRRGRRALCVASLLITAGISGAAMATSANDDPVLTVAWPYDVGPLDTQGYGANQMMAQAMVYEPLVRFHDGRLEPWLATQWSVSDDGLSYRFTLRDDVTFSDGAPFDAAAVKANLDAVMACRDHHAWLALANKLESVSIFSRDEVELHLKTAYYPTLMELSLIRPLRFASPSSLQSDLPAEQGGCRLSRPIGTGPWVFSGREPGRVDHFKRNPNYWGDLPAYAGVDVRLINDPNTRAVALETGQIDLVQGARGLISEDSFQRFAQDPRFEARNSPPLATRTFVLNSHHGPTRFLAVRQAIEHAVDKRAIVASLLFDAEPVAQALFSRQVPYADIDLAPYEFDVDEARSLLDQAGWTPGEDGIRTHQGEPLTLDLYFVGDDPLQKAMSQVVQANLKQVGMQVRLHGEEETALMSRQKSGEFSIIYSDTWGAPYEPHAYLSSMRVAAHADYQAQLGLPNKAEIDREIGELLTEQDEAARQAGYTRLLRELHESAIYVPISFVTARSVSRRDAVEDVGFGDTMEDISFSTMRPAGE
ncbi:nickel ABC transporter substrate-binding protein [Salinicola lusitanus]|uniref:nickel ABC transporter substrate-binding protein n=1 Tax=Salinicola lusitanus TaxID=1949085 RepID=UPI0019802C31|nr:nickel ABC transporter substrate-binding protein [Salinicola lusitanus]